MKERYHHHATTAVAESVFIIPSPYIDAFVMHSSCIVVLICHIHILIDFLYLVDVIMDMSCVKRVLMKEIKEKSYRH